MPSIPSTDEGITGVKPPYQDALLDTFRELMAVAETKVLEQYNSGRITGKEYAQVYLGTIQYAMSMSAQLAKDAAEIQYKIDNTLALDKQIKQEQILQLQAETLFKKTQKAQIEQSVYDNRQLKIMDSLADMTGMILNGGTQAVPTGLATELTNAITAIKAIPKEVIV